MVDTDTTRGRTDVERTRVPDDVVAALLDDERCRQTLSCLAAADEPVAVEDLARDIVARERDVDPDAIGSDTVRQARDELFQDCLPKLTPTGIVSYNSLLGTVSLASDDDRIVSAVE